MVIEIILVSDNFSGCGSIPIINLMVIFFISVLNLQSQDRYRVTKPDSEIVFDGLCNEEAWRNIEPFKLITFAPDYGAEPSEKTEIRIAYDETTVYDHINKPEWNIGLDTKMRVSDNLTLDLSLNTDFAQVEDDNQRVNLTRFPLFF